MHQENASMQWMLPLHFSQLLWYKASWVFRFSFVCLLDPFGFLGMWGPCRLGINSCCWWDCFFVGFSNVYLNSDLLWCSLAYSDNLFVRKSAIVSSQLSFQKSLHVLLSTVTFSFLLRLSNFVFCIYIIPEVILFISWPH